MESFREQHYAEKSLRYGAAHTRRARILDLARGYRNARILDIGCARGYLGARLKEQGNYVAGIEISESAAAEARKVLDAVHVLDLERAWSQHLSGERFDCVIAAEVIEHLFDPVSFLNGIRDVLND